MNDHQFSTDEQTARLQKRAILVERSNAYPSSSERTHTSAQFFADFDALEQNKHSVTLVGRLVSQRIHGGSSFASIEDQWGAIQIFLSKQDVGETLYEDFCSLTDNGDFIEAVGIAYITKRGEKSLFVHSWRMLTKAVLPLPEKWHGLSDTETRFRKRYLDLLMNKDVRNRAQTRSKIISAIRRFCDRAGIMEVETPTLQPLYGGGFAKPFITHHHALNSDFYLRISDEMYLKRLLVGSLDAVYEITKVFRNEGIDRDHNPEFTMFEAQVAYKNYLWGMDFFEELYAYCAQETLGTTDISHESTVISCARPWKRMKLVDAVREIGHIDVSLWQSVSDAKDALKAKGLSQKQLDAMSRIETLGELIAFAFEEFVEEQLIQPTIIYDYPIEVSPLAKKCDDPNFTQRFEAFCLGMEIGNNYSELNDPVDLEQRFFDEKKKESAGNDEAHQTDDDYLTAIKHGLPPACGLGIGVDRMIMVLTGTSNIKEVILFPTLKPE